MQRYSRTHRSHGKWLPMKTTPHEPVPPPWMASGYRLVLGWLAFWVLWWSFRVGVVSPESSVLELPPPSLRVARTLILVPFFLELGWVFRFSGFLFGFFLLGF